MAEERRLKEISSLEGKITELETLLKSERSTRGLITVGGGTLDLAAGITENGEWE